MASLSQIFAVFAKVGAFTIGGGYAMIPVIEKEMRRRDWISAEDIEEVVVLAQSAPGLLAVNMAIFTGYRLRGIKGSVVATLGAVLPSFVIMLLVAMFFSAFSGNEIIGRIFQGVRPVAVALILVPAVQMAGKRVRSWWAWALMLATFFLVAFLKVSPIWILLTVIVSAVCISMAREGRKK